MQASRLQHMCPTCPAVRSETWTLLKEEGRKRQAFHMRCQRQLLGIRWSDFIINVKVLESTGLSDIRDNIAGRCHSLFGYIRRLPADVLVHMALKLSVDVCSGTKPSTNWTRPLGCPRNTWIKQLEEDSGIAAGELWVKVRNHKDWVTLRQHATS